MRKSLSIMSSGTADVSPNSVVSTPGELPRSLMTAFEVAAFVGCHEESVRRAYLCGQLKRRALRRAELPLRSSGRAGLDRTRRTDESLVKQERASTADGPPFLDATKGGAHGCSKDLQAQGLSRRVRGVSTRGGST